MSVFQKSMSAVCICFTVITVAVSLWGLMSGQSSETDPAAFHAHQLLRFVICLVAIGSGATVKLAWNGRSEWLLAAHYLATLAIVLLLVWAVSFVLPLAEHAYRDLVWNYSLFYSLFIGMLSIIKKNERKRRG